MKLYKINDQDIYSHYDDYKINIETPEKEKDEWFKEESKQANYE